MSIITTRKINRDSRVLLPRFLLNISGLEIGDVVIMDAIPNGITIRKAVVQPDRKDVSALRTQFIDDMNDMSPGEKETALMLLYNSLFNQAEQT